MIFFADSSASSSAYHFFNDQIHIAEQKLNEVEKRQTLFKQSQEIISPEVQKDILLAKVSDYEKALTNVRTRRIGKEAMLKVIKEQMLKGVEANIPDTESSNSLSREKFIAKLKKLHRVEIYCTRIDGERFS